MTSVTARFVSLLQEKIDALAATRTLLEGHRRLNDLEHLILCDLLTEEQEQLVLNAAGELRIQSQELFCRFETLIEQSMTRYLVHANVGTIFSPENITQNYLQRYHFLAAQEIALAHIKAHDRVLFIGSGPLPITAIEYAHQTGCKVDCIDHLPEPVRLSSDVIHHLNLDNHIRLIHASGQEHPVAGYDVILVAVLAEPKEQILSHLDQQADEKCRLICRTTVGIRQYIYPCSISTKLTRFKQSGFSQARGDQAISSQLFTACVQPDG